MRSAFRHGRQRLGMVFTWYQTNLNQADMKDLAIVQGFPALLDDGGGRQNCVVRGGSWHARRQVDLRTRL